MKEPQNAAGSARDTIDKIRAKQNSLDKAGEASATVEVPTLDKKPARRRVSAQTKAVSANSRNEFRAEILKALLLGEMTQGEALKALRISVLGLKQDAFAKLVSVSRKTLSEVENDKGNYTSDIINKLFRPFGMKVGLVPVSRHMFAALIKKNPE